MSRKGLLAKVSRPRLFDVVPRERLFALLDQNRDRPLIWIASPPGAGKTTLIASYLEARGMSSIWYQIDAGDADPATMFDHLSQAASPLRDKANPPLPRFSAEHAADVAAFARIYFRALFSRLPTGVVLVLDNFQDAPEGAALHDIVRECVMQTPPGHSVIGVSRVDAPQSFVQFAASSAMVTLGWDKLQLTRDEVNAICAKRGVTEGWLVQALHQQSQGWAAGITLMLERFEHADGTARELPTETRESVFDYFASLLFDQAADASRQILLSVALLPRVTPSLALELSGRNEAPALLDDLYRRHLFTDRRPDAEPVYQFHALFLDFLRAKARATLDATRFSNLVLRSARALEAANAIDAAVALWLDHEHWDEATRVILEQAERQLRDGRRQTLLRWIESLPEAWRADRPWLVYWQGRARLQIEPEAGTRRLEQALQLFRRNDDHAGLLDCLATLVGGAFLGFHALQSMDGWLDEFLAEIQRAPGFSSANFELRIWSVLCMTLFHARPWHPLTQPAYLRVEALLPQCTDPDVALGAALGALVVSGLSGDFERGDRLADLAMGLASRETASPSEAAWCFGQVGWLRFQEARYEAALDSLEKGRLIAEANGLNTVKVALVLWRHTIEWRVVRWSVASATLAEAETLSHANQPMHAAQIALFRARQANHRGHRDEAVNLALLAHERVMAVGSRLQEIVFSLSGADILLAANRPDTALPLLAHARSAIDRAPIYGCFRAIIELLEARHDCVCGDRPTALLKLRRALALAHEGNNRYYLRFADWTMPPMFSIALEAGIEVDLVRDVIRMQRLKPPADAPDSWPWPVRIVTLGRFDVMVDGNSLEFPRKLPRKTLMLLKAIVALGGHEVSEEILCDALWGDEDGDAASNALAITVVRLRKLLGHADAIVQQGGRISVNPGLCWIDARVFEKRAGAAEAPSLDRLNLYAGAFLPDDQSEPWSVAARERLRGRFIDLLSGCGMAMESAGDLASAVQCYLRGIDADPVVEAFHQGLMRCYERLGRRTEAISAYRRMKQMLSVVLGVPPSEASQQLYVRLLEGQLAEGDAGAFDTAATVVRLESRRPKAPRGGA